MIHQQSSSLSVTHKKFHRPRTGADRSRVSIDRCKRDDVDYSKIIGDSEHCESKATVISPKSKMISAKNRSLTNVNMSKNVNFTKTDVFSPKTMKVPKPM